MDKNAVIKVACLEYSRRLELIKNVQSSFDSNIAFYIRRKRKMLLLVRKLRNLQLLLLAALNENIKRRSLWKLNRSSKFWEVCCASDDDRFFRSHFRMSRVNFEALCGLLQNLNKANTNWRKAIPLPKRVAIALFALGSCEKYQVVFDLFGVGGSTGRTILLQFCREVWDKMSHLVEKCPLTQKTVVESVNGFHHLGLPQCLGVIDGRHLKIRPNPGDAADYYNSKGWHSIVLLTLVDYRHRFLYVDIEVPGGRSDSEIFNSCKLKLQLEESEILTSNKKEFFGVEVPVYVVGNAVFPFSKTIMKPYPSSHELSKARILYNKKISKCKKVVDRAFCHLNARFRRIRKGLNNIYGNVPTIVRACCVLHNFLNEQNDAIDKEWLNELKIFETQLESPTSREGVNGSELGAESIRQAIVSYLGAGSSSE